VLALAVIVILELPFCNRPEFIVVILPVVKIPVVAPMLPTFAFPDTFAVPDTFAPVDVTTNTLAVPPAEMFTLPAEAGIDTTS